MKVLLRTFGCRANQYDTEAVRALLAASGAEETSEPTEASFAIFNSCTVTARAEADLRSEVRAVARQNPSIESLIMGCAAGIARRDESKSPLETLPRVRWVVGGADLPAIGAALGLSPSGKQDSPRTALQTGARALLRIQDGCDEHCTFCATTLARGSNRSRSVESLVGEASVLAARHPEIVITGIHIGAYGMDVGSSLGQLMVALIQQVPDVRFRLSSVEATEVDETLRDLFVSAPTRLAPYLHAPLQSGSNAVLRRMGRHWYTAESYEEAVICLLPAAAPFALSADIITGFPGETPADHAATMAMLERLPFTSLHVFPYSPRPGTPALNLKDAVPVSTAKGRAEEMRVLAADKGARYAAGRLGGKCDVVVTDRGKGLTEDYLAVRISDPSLPRRSRFSARLAMDEGRLTAVREQLLPP